VRLKMPLKKFFVSEVFKKNVNFQCAFDDLSVTPIFIKQIFRAKRKHPPAL
jgi:hypothetical protein